MANPALRELTTCDCMLHLITNMPVNHWTNFQHSNDSELVEKSINMLWVKNVHFVIDQHSESIYKVNQKTGCFLEVYNSHIC